MLKTQHLLVDCCEVPRQVCLDDAKMLETMAEAAELAGATVISQVRYHFGAKSPPGFAAVVLLDESHCSAHSYADLGLVALDVFTCGKVDALTILQHICRELGLHKVTVTECQRFISGREMDV